MSAQHDHDLFVRLTTLDAHQARRVTRLILECCASLRDALAAVEDADRQSPGSEALAAVELGAARSK